jgi:ribose transport system substrate-binding protein
MARISTWLAAVAMLACVAVLAACGSDDDSGSSGGGGGGGGDGSFGAGLKLTDDVIASPEVATIKGPWVRWNSKTCSYEKTSDHPAEYKPELRRVADPMQIGYMHYGNVDTFGISNSKNIEELADKAGFDLNVYNLKYPSETEPLNQAKTSALKGDKGVITGTQTLWDEQYKILADEGCAPAVQLYSLTKTVPNFGVNWANAGTEIGKALAEAAKAKGWDPAKTALVQCTNPDYGPAVAEMFKTAPAAVKDSGYELADSNVFDLTCKVGKNEAVTTDWFTAHPDFDQILMDTVDDPSADGMINAIRKAGKESNTILMASGADPQGRKAIRAGTQAGSLAFFPERYGEWALAILEDILAGNPVPTEVNHPTPMLTADNVDEYYPDDK